MEYLIVGLLIVVGLGGGLAFRQHRRTTRQEPFKTQLHDSRK